MVGAASEQEVVLCGTIRHCKDLPVVSLDFCNGLVTRACIPANACVELMNFMILGMSYSHHKHFIVAHTSEGVVLRRMPVYVLRYGVRQKSGTLTPFMILTPTTDVWPRNTVVGSIVVFSLV